MGEKSFHDIFTPRIEGLEKEYREVGEYPEELFCEIIRDVGFECNFCAKCCTKDFNGHVFLLDSETDRIREIDPGALLPAPGFDYCDQHGNFYVAGYCIKTRDNGECCFLKDRRCTIYENRPKICRIYPFMIHKEPDDRGKVDWRIISGLNEHGCYHSECSESDCRRIYLETREYEMAFLDHQIRFLRYIKDYFEKNSLRHVRKIYDDKMREVNKGKKISVFVYEHDRFSRNEISIDAYRS